MSLIRKIYQLTVSMVRIRSTLSPKQKLGITEPSKTFRLSSGASSSLRVSNLTNSPVTVTFLPSKLDSWRVAWSEKTPLTQDGNLSFLCMACRVAKTIISPRRRAQPVMRVVPVSLTCVAKSDIDNSLPAAQDIDENVTNSDTRRHFFIGDTFILLMGAHHKAALEMSHLAASPRRHSELFHTAERRTQYL